MALGMLTPSYATCCSWMLYNFMQTNRRKNIDPKTVRDFQ